MSQDGWLNSSYYIQIPGSKMRKGEEGHASFFSKETPQKVYETPLSMFHWPELKGMAMPKNKGGWEMQSSLLLQTVVFSDKYWESVTKEREKEILQ